MIYDSGITAQSFIDNLCIELDVPSDFSIIEKYELVQYLNIIEKILYKNIIKEINDFSVSPENNEITLSSINTAINNTYDNVSFSDIVRLEEVSVIDDKPVATEYTKCNLDKLNILTNYYAVDGDSIKLNPEKDFDPATQLYSDHTVTSVTIYLVVCPVKKVITTTDNKETINGNINVPYEFIPMIKAYIRGELYKVINEDEIAAKWIADFNAQLENFKQYITSASAMIG